MKSTGIVFSAPMVLALLAGRKTQTRRLINPQPAHGCRYTINGAHTHALHLSDIPGREFVPPTAKSTDHRLPCPYGAAGARLYVKEAWRPLARHEGATLEVPPVVVFESGVVPAYRVQNGIAYRADNRVVWREHITTIYDGSGTPAKGPKRALEVAGEPIRWKSPRYMRRHDSRIELDLTDVRVERLNDISSADALAEGIDGRPDELKDGWVKLAYARLWSSLHGKKSWDENPWVWVLAFQRVDPVATERE